MPMLQDKSQVETIPSTSLPVGSEQKQRRQMLLALALLLAALILVLVKDRQFWFPASSAGGDAEQVEPAEATPSQAPATKTQTPAAPTHPKEHTKAAPVPVSQPQTVPPVVMNRAVLPPLEVEVVAGDTRRTVASGSPAVRVDVQPGVPARAMPAPQGAGAANVATNASERVRLSPDTVQVVSRPVEPNYPMLAKQMKVQGSVILQALIGKEGSIQDLQVISGPAILSTAALEAVRQWRFKPYYQAGEAVETQARITVNFTISTY